MRFFLACICVLLIASACIAQDEFKLVLRNPDMEAGKDLPDGWNGQFGKVLVMRDTQTFHNGKASLSVQNSSTSSGSAHQMIAVKPGMKLKLSAWLKCAEATKASFAAQFFDEKFTWNEFGQIKHTDGPFDWELCEKEITVPEQASRMAIALYVEGVGQAWLDDVMLSADGAKVEITKEDAVPTAPKEPTDAKLIPTTTLPGFFADYPKGWNAFHETFLKRTREGGIDVLFLGDSLTQGWAGAGRATWDANFAPLKAANFGIGGDKTGNILWRLDHGEVDGLTPKLVVLLIGVNNLWSGKNNGQEIAGGTKAIIEKLKQKLPQSKVLVLGVLPMGATAEEAGRLKAQEINVHALSIGDGVMVKYADIGAKFVQKNGKLLEGAYAPDNLHLTTKGYEIFAKELLPLITEMLK